jgi:hypothetical protein
MLSRHGSRYPTTGTNVFDFGKRMGDAAGTFKAKEALSFLNDWKYQLGAEILVPKGESSGVLPPGYVLTIPCPGREELFQSGTTSLPSHTHC